MKLRRVHILPMAFWHPIQKRLLPQRCLNLHLIERFLLWEPRHSTWFAFAQLPIFFKFCQQELILSRWLQGSLQFGYLILQVRLSLFLMVRIDGIDRTLVLFVRILSLVQDVKNLKIFLMSDWVILMGMTLCTCHGGSHRVAKVVFTRSTTATLRNSSSLVPPSLFVWVLR